MYTINIFIEISLPHSQPTKRQYPLKRKDANLQLYHLFILYEDLNARVSILEEIFRLSPII